MRDWEGEELRANREIHDFGWALKLLKLGKPVRRKGWNGKGLWLKLQVPDEHSKMTLPYVYMEYPRWSQNVATGEVIAGSYLYPEGCRVPWLASVTDMLAEDWELSEEF